MMVYHSCNCIHADEEAEWTEDILGIEGACEVEVVDGGW